MASKELKDYVAHTKELINGGNYTEEIANALFQAAQLSINSEKDINFGLEITKMAKEVIENIVSKQTGADIWKLEAYCIKNQIDYEILQTYYNVLRLEAPFLFESFIFYMEKKRPQEKRFYLGRRKTLKVVVDDLQDLEERKIKFYGLSLPSRTGKSTLGIFFLAWIMLKRPNSHNAMGGHSGLLAKGFYKELLNLIDTEEYTFYELFADYHPHSKSFLTDKSAEEFTITLDNPDRFATITCRGIDGTWTGAVDVSRDGYLYVDDLVRDREHSLSPQRMENTFQEYLNKMVDRKNDGARELMVGTLWNVLDPLERIRKLNEDNPAFRFRKIPALNENDETNFNYDFNLGFSTEYYHEMRERLDKAEWMAKFQQQPFVREGILFESDTLRYFNGIMPEGNYRNVAIVDVALGGGDSLSMPIGRQYENGDVYIYDWVFNKGVKEITIPIVVGKIIENNITEIRFEANQGGDLYCAWVDEELMKSNYKCSCTHKRAPNNMEKASKIVAYSGDVKRKFIFLDSKKISREQRETDTSLGITRYTRSKEYQNAIDEFTSYVTIGKNEHDDAVDGITQLSMFLENDEVNEVLPVFNPFRGYRR